MRKRNRNAALFLSAALLLGSLTAGLVSCGGGGEPANPTWVEDSGSFSFKTNTKFTGADSLPSVDHVVAFVPKATSYTTYYCWEGVGSGSLPEGVSDWPGLAIPEEYDSSWLKVDLPGITSTNIIFNRNGSPQTRDMSITHAGYWWFYESDGDIHDSIPVSAWLDSAKFIDSKTIQVVSNVDMSEVILYEDDAEILNANPNKNAIDIKMNGHTVDLTKSYKVKVKLTGETKEYEMAVDIKALYEDESFDSKYAYTGDDLGATYSAASTTFKVWSPFSQSVKVRIYNSGTPTDIDVSNGDDTYTETVMILGDHGVYSATIEGDLAGKYYTYVVTNGSWTNKEVVDPYARSTGINGRRGMILNLATTNPEGWDSITPHAIDRKALTVWECHIADLTSSETWTGPAEDAKKYSGFHYSGTTYTNSSDVTVKTGFDHVKEMGVNAVQILPMFDQDNDERSDTFNWGYNPLNYNSPDGIYSKDPYHGEVKVNEVKSLIKDYNEAGINIIMDVVYNHVAGAVGSNFDVLVPGYYYRYSTTGALANGSGCGNETASDHYMFRKFMIDSCVYWAKEYKLGGFRFDLMGLHDYETMNLLTEAVKKVNPNIVIYGEPWQGGNSPLDAGKTAKQANLAKFEGYGAFNDVFRDALIKGGLNSPSMTGWATTTDEENATELKSIIAGLRGTTNIAVPVEDPDKAVNYVTCHDNYTLLDRVAYLYSKRSFVPKMAMLADAVTLTAQGTTFMLSGDEFMRTKGGDSNSYKSSYKVNELDWNLKATNINYVENFKKLIALKTKVDGMHLDKAGCAALEFKTAKNSGTVSWEIKDTANNKTYKIAHNNWNGGENTVDFSGYELYLDTLGSGVTLSSATPMNALQTIIAVK